MLNACKIQWALSLSRLKEENKIRVILSVTEVLVCIPFELIFTVKVNRVALHLVSASLSDQCPEGLVEHSSSQYCQGNVHAEWI